MKATLVQRLLWCALLAAHVGSAQAADPPTAAPGQLTQLLSWLGGEFDNNEQVWQQQLDAADPKVSPKPAAVDHQRQLLAPVTVPRLGSHVFYLQQALADTPGEPFRQGLARFSAPNADGVVRMELWRFTDAAAMLDAHLKPAVLAALTLAQLQSLPLCELDWRWNPGEQTFTGRSRAGGCSLGAGRSAREENWLLSADTLTITESASPAPFTRNRKLRYFAGWVWIKHAGPQAASDDRKASFTRGLLLHTEGQRIAINYEDGSASPYLLELAQLTYQNTRQPILKLALVDKASGKSVSYTWANTEATMIGMNLGWFQAGLTKKPE